MLEGLFQPMHLLVIFFIALLVFGPRKLPELGKGLGEGIRALKDGMKDHPPEQASTDQDLHVGLKGGKTVVGPVTTSDGKLEIASKSGGTVEAPKEDVAVIRNDAEQAAYDKSLHPGLLHGWNGGINVGFALARGNSQTENLAVAFNATHPTENDKTTIYLTSIDTNNQLATPSTVANLV